MITINKILQIITNKFLYKFYLLIIFMLFVTILEMLTLGMIIPIVNLVTDFDTFINNYYIQNYLSFILQFDQKKIITFSLIVLLVFFIVKSLFNLAFVYFQSRFINILQLSLQNKVFKSLMLRSYKYHVNQNSSKLISANTREIVYFMDMISAITTIIIEGLIVIGLISILIYISPLATINTTIIIIFIGVLINFLTKKKLYAWGKERQSNEVNVFKHLQQGLNGIKDIKMYGKEITFIDRLFKPTSIIAKISVYVDIIRSIPRISLEMIFVIAIIVLSSTVIFLEDNEGLLPKLAIFAGAGFRLLPSGNRIISNIQNIPYTLPSIERIYDILNQNINDNINFANEKKIQFNQCVELRNIFFKYNDQTIIFNKTNLKINKNECIGIIGESGSGKSTFVDLFTGLIGLNSGEINVDQYNIKNKFVNWRKNIGYVPQNVFLTDEKIINNIALGVNENQIDIERVKEVIDLSDLNKYINSLENNFNHVVGESGAKLSGGQRQRIGIARALYNNPEILIFDESTSALDLQTEKNIIDNLANFKNKKTIIIISHRPSTLIHCDKIYKIINKNFELIN
jgi:ATP-binding cassette, subfamily B, bacterial PglK